MVKQNKPKPELMIGGQAVIEGVLMRTPKEYAVAVRQPNGRIVVKKEKYISSTKTNKFLGLPFARGIIVLFETLVLGYKALSFSANKSMEEPEKDKKAGKEKVKDAKVGKSKEKQEIGPLELGITLAISIIFALALFKFLPLLIATLFKDKIGGSNLLFNLIDGISKFIIFILYLVIISSMKDVRRVFEYHGAEHKTVYCYEAGKKLTPKNVIKESKAHPRCGTTFILVVLLLSIIFYLFIPFNMNFWLKLFIRVLFLPLIAGISYEWIRLMGKHTHSRMSRFFSAPGLLVQKLTTREPDEKQIEVAIASLKAVTGSK
ncbi:DUF1385 domain-containing protein [Candidatus Woesearchaeota archaeon]|nr:DUF1385 domain-containing protein [Candidatus Woesearchaeota archaeon]